MTLCEVPACELPFCKTIQNCPIHSRTHFHQVRRRRFAASAFQNIRRC